ncbi:hypothetical protein NDU88_007408 [Pleurodeles waltl]|uniref:KRAB domain-containing protein n=1 Tax=Pleurodeles waltl TaxID=8319 RepID=A0AAV7UQ10_PLEWA|nr:hypothetical protein NDU88_007408 [Pleurodeles waltl]
MRVSRSQKGFHRTGGFRPEQTFCGRITRPASCFPLGTEMLFDMVAFHEAPSCFSEEEWKLLQEWQKELYGNVMKEIHQALISLGPLITTTVFSLRAKEKQKQCPMDIPRSYGRHSINRSQSDPMNSPDECFIVRDAYSNNSKDKKGRGKKDCLSGEEEPPSIFVYSIGEDLEERATDPDSGHDIISFSMADKQEPNCMNHATNTKKENIVSPTGDPINCPDELFIVNRKEHLNNPLDTEENRKDSLNRGEHCHSREHGIISFSIKDEEESYCMDHKNNTGMESIHSPAAVPVITAVFSLSTKPEEEICAQKIKSEKTASGEHKNLELLTEGQQWHRFSS